MKLRTRLVLSIVGAGVPLAIGLGWLPRARERRQAEEALRELALLALEGSGRAICEARAASWMFDLRPPPGRPPGGPPGPPRGLGGPPGPLPGLGADREPDDRPPPPPPPGPPRPGDAEPLGMGGPPAGLRPPHIRIYAYDVQGRSENPDAPPLDPSLLAGLADTPRASHGRALEGRHSLELLVRLPWRQGPCALALVRRTGGPPGADHDPALGTALLAALILAIVLLATGPVVARIRHLTRAAGRLAADRYEGTIDVHGDDEVAELGRALNAAAGEVRAHIGEVEARERALREFLANTTHDVMIPLTVLQGHLARLRRRELGPGEVALVGAALEEAHYLAAMVQNLATAAKLQGTPSFERHRVRLDELCDRVVARHRPIAEERGLSLERGVPPDPVEVMGDVTLLEQAVSNLVHNAVRHNEGGKHVALVLETGGGRFTLRVLDDGPGIAEAERASVLERGLRGDRARGRHPGGLGLGLAIVREVAARHGFALALAENEGGGLAVSVSGPLA